MYRSGIRGGSWRSRGCVRGFMGLRKGEIDVNEKRMVRNETCAKPKIRFMFFMANGKM